MMIPFNYYYNNRIVD